MSTGAKHREAAQPERRGGDFHSGYLAIERYGVIGNLHTAALVGGNGSIDWCCFPDLGDPSVFGAILDARRGGHFRIGPAPDRSEGAAPEEFPIDHGEQAYLPGTNTLRTTFRIEGAGVLVVTDFMPVWGELEGPGRAEAAPEIHRLVECREGRVEVELQWAPRFDYARTTTRIRRHGDGYLADDGAARLALSSVPGAAIEEEDGNPVVTARFSMEEGQLIAIVTRWDSDDVGAALEASQEQLARTGDAWRAWLKGKGPTSARDWAGEWLPYVQRSSLVFKLLTNADTGAIAAAPTTSLPEVIGGVRNWDYRFAWIRDAAMTAQAMVSLGHAADAAALIQWMEEISAEHEDGGRNLKVMYGLHGEDELPEEELDHMEGYRGSRPVRIGNEAAEQFQLEVFGELINAAYEMARRGRTWEPKIVTFIQHVAETVCRTWREPDFGIWEMRSGPQHFTYSKVMAWVALDRAVRLVREYGFGGDAERWARICDEIREQVLEHGYNKRLGSFVMTFDGEELDAALLRIPLMEFLPVEDPRVEGTIDRIMEQLVTNDLVYRYRVDDGLPGEEGAFGLCTFWLVDVLSLAHRCEEARRIFKSMIGRANELGLFAEEIDPKSGIFLGNFPQAFTHIGLINSALYLAWGEGENRPEDAPIGTKEHREGGEEARS